MACGCVNHKAKSSGAIAGRVLIGPVAKRGEYAIYPHDQCVFCAEKHLSYAWRVAKECGYENTNRQCVIGELQATIQHLWIDNRALAEQVRAIRHLIQQRREAEVDWHPLLTAMDWTATAAASENVKPEEST